jgi:hypothetical protein
MGSIIQIEDHEVDLYGVWMLHLIVRPEFERPSRRHYSKLVSCIGLGDRLCDVVGFLTQ